MSETSNPNVNGLRIVADFQRMTDRHDDGKPEIERIYRELVEIETALEGFAVLLNELECQQIRADYLKCLLEPHIERTGRAVSALSTLI